VEEVRASDSEGRRLKPLMQYILTVDTEWDRLPDRDGTIATANLAALPAFHALCSEYGVRPCYLATQEAAESPVFEAFANPVIAREGGEVGTHLHPWTTPPYPDDPLTARIRCPFPNEYPDDVFEAKLVHLRNTLEQRFGPQRTYRAGRWGLAESHVPILARHGYRVDTSITPYTSWTEVPGLGPHAGPDHTRFGPRPFRWAGSGMTEIPVTVVLDGPRRWHATYGRGRLGRWWAARRGVTPRWARPLPGGWSALDRVLDLAVDANLPLLVMTMHSNELDPKTNPYFTSRAMVDEMLSRLAVFFRRLEERGIAGTTPSEWAARHAVEAASS
jgi:hypothetical protein